MHSNAPTSRSAASTRRIMEDRLIVEALYVTEQLSWDDEADEAFAEATGCAPDDAHKRRVAALRRAVEAGRATAEWTGVGMTPYSGSARRNRVYKGRVSLRNRV